MQILKKKKFHSFTPLVAIRQRQPQHYTLDCITHTLASERRRDRSKRFPSNQKSLEKNGSAFHDIKLQSNK